MYAVGLNNYGGPEVLHLMKLPDPHPEPGQVRMRVQSAGIEVFLRAVGATEFIVRGDNVVRRVRRSFAAGVDGVVDAAGLREQIVPAVRDGGTVIILRSWKNGGLERAIQSVFVNVRDRVTDHTAIARLGQQVSDGLLSMRVAAIFPAADAAAAHLELAKGGLRGRIILNFDGLEL